MYNYLSVNLFPETVEKQSLMHKIVYFYVQKQAIMLKSNK